MTLHSTDLHFSVDTASPAQTRHTAKGFYRRFVKRAIDCMLVLLAAPVIVPLIAIAALLIARDGGSPFYVQSRVGQNGRIFRMWKLRSMVPNADEILEKYLSENPEARAEWDSTQKLKTDPRITPIGKFIRKTSLDELPQLWNVLKGDMSLVGPRPVVEAELSRYGAAAEHYLVARPGITGLWQVSGRSSASKSVNDIVLKLTSARQSMRLMTLELRGRRFLLARWCGNVCFTDVC